MEYSSFATVMWMVMVKNKKFKVGRSRKSVYSTLNSKGYPPSLLLRVTERAWVDKKEKKQFEFGVHTNVNCLWFLKDWMNCG